MILENFKEELNEVSTKIDGEVNFNIYDGVLESYINDYTIFEATLRRDFLEVNGVLTEAGDKNFFKSIWGKIVAFCGKIRQWIKNVIERFKNAVIAFKETQFKQKLNSYMPYFKDSKADELLKDFTISGYKFKTVNAKTMEYAVKMGENIAEKYVVPLMEDPLFNKSMKDLTEDDINKINNKIKEISIEDIAKEFHGAIYSETDIEKPFKEQSYLKEELIRLVEISSLMSLGNMDKKFEGFLNLFNKNIDNLSKNANKLIDEYANNMKNYGQEVDDDSIEETKAVAQQIIKFLPPLQSKCNTILTLVYNEMVKETKEYIRVYLAAGKYLKSKLKKGGNSTEDKKVDNKNNTPNNDKKEETSNKEESYISNEYNNVLAEATMYELGL